MRYIGDRMATKLGRAFFDGMEESSKAKVLAAQEKLDKLAQETRDFQREQREKEYLVVQQIFQPVAR